MTTDYTDAHGSIHGWMTDLPYRDNRTGGPMEIVHRQLSELIIGCGMKVLNTLKPGVDENALVIELTKRGHHIDQQKRFDVLYEGQVVDTLIPDLIVDERVIVDPKVVEDFTPTHVAKMIGYLTITNLRLALLINFKFADLRWKRIVK